MALSLDKENKINAAAPKLLSLAKSAAISLAKSNMATHKAKVALALDVSGSMSDLVNSGAVQRVCERALALGLNFDDDGEIDVFIFGRSVANLATLGVNNISGFVERFWSGPNHKRADWQGTNYAPVLKAVANHFFTAKSTKSGLLGMFGKPAPVSGDLPAYVMFITDGENADREDAAKELIAASYGPVFFQFIGIGSEDFKFLKKLDDLSGRHVDNANFFAVRDIDAMSDDELYTKMMGEYPQWVKLAKGSGLLQA